MSFVILLQTIAVLALWLGQRFAEARLDRIEKQLGIKGKSSHTP